ncbi:MAG: NAD(P)-dependent oxidoreductase [Halobacteriovoraceae bacterium]|nr:NAD(P)-dependent oxidoreductase [Halobacteriovoraceae bacterium]
MKVLVTGGAGYIGSLLVPTLISNGHEVTVIDNLMYKQAPLLECMADKKFNFIRGDVRDQSLLKKEVPKADAILGLACIVGAPLCDRDPLGAQMINADAIKNIYDLKAKDQIMVYPCTNSGYGIGQEGIYCDENTPLNPVSIYGKTKVEAESYILNGGEAATLRFATLFGTAPRMRLDLLVNDFTYRAFYDRFIVLFESHFKRNYLHIRDAVKSFTHVMENYDKMKGQPYNVGLSDTNISKMELCERIKKYLPDFHIVESEIGKDPDKRNYIISNEKIESTGFKTEYSLDDGIQELIKSFGIIKREQFANI